jgi:hypothetical protein
MLSLAPRLSLADVEGGLGRQRSDVPLPRAVLRSLCATLDWLRLDPSTETVSMVTQADPERVLSKLERLLVGIFHAEGPVLGFTQSSQLAAAQGMNPTTAGVYLGRSPVFQTVSRGRYAIRGYGGEAGLLVA